MKNISHTLWFNPCWQLRTTQPLTGCPSPAAKFFPLLQQTQGNSFTLPECLCGHGLLSGHAPWDSSLTGKCGRMFFPITVWQKPQFPRATLILSGITTRYECSPQVCVWCFSPLKDSPSSFHTSSLLPGVLSFLVVSQDAKVQVSRAAKHEQHSLVPTASLNYCHWCERSRSNLLRFCLLYFYCCILCQAIPSASLKYVWIFSVSAEDNRGK